MRLLAVAWMLLFTLTLVPAAFPLLSRQPVGPLPLGVVWVASCLLGFFALSVWAARRHEVES